MASSHPSKPTRSRQRSSSDPFSDLVYHNSSTRSHRAAPAPPAQMTQTTAQRPHRDNIADAVRETVTVRGSDQPARTRMARSQTSVPATQPPPVLPRPHASKRSQSQDSVLVAAAALEKAKANGKGKGPKKGSMHADVIDRLDFTGVGPMFHHDGPFDACAPSRNRHRNKAPMLAWSGDPNNSELAHNSDSAYPSAQAMRGNYASYDPPKKKVDVIAEAWGTHEPEPFEDFSAGGGATRLDGVTPTSSIYNNREGHSNTSSTRSGTHRSKRSKDSRDIRDLHRDYATDGEQPSVPRRNAAKRSTLPPPRPIFVGHDEALDDPGPLPSPPTITPSSPGIKRNKSLMHRIRKMRDSPNVPVGESDILPPTSPNGQDLGFPFYTQQNDASHRPRTSGEKDLPITPTSPGEGGELGYFDEFGNSPNGRGAGGLGRKTSLLKKVRGVVRGNK